MTNYNQVEYPNDADRAAKGGPGSGHFGHRGIPGHHGGSLPGRGGPGRTRARQRRLTGQGAPGRAVIGRRHEEAVPQNGADWAEEEQRREQERFMREQERASRRGGGGGSSSSGGGYTINLPYGSATYDVDTYSATGIPAYVPRRAEVAPDAPPRAGWNLLKSIAKMAAKTGAVMLISGFVSTALFPSNFRALMEAYNEAVPPPDMWRHTDATAMSPDTVRAIQNSRVS